MSAADALLEATAEAVVFAHEPDCAAMPSTPVALELERTAALVAAAIACTQAPPGVQRHLAAAGLAFCAAQRATPARPAAIPIAADAKARQRRSLVLPFVLGIAAGAALLLALQSAGPRPTPREQLASLLRDDTSAVRIGWKGGPSPLRGDVVGEVVWSQDRQEGYLTFRGLPPLGPDQRFQLWIVDGMRDGAPVDGGLFAIGDPAAETVVPVQARLPIGKPAAFVVTVEPKVGVVVSKQENVVAIAGL